MFKVAHDVIFSHWTPSWLILQISLSVCSEVVVLIFIHLLFKRIKNVNFKILGITGHITNIQHRIRIFTTSNFLYEGKLSK